MMNVLFIGDVVGSRACTALGSFLPPFKSRHAVDLTIINGENSADGNGISHESAEYLLTYADVITTGNHCFKKHSAAHLLESNPCVLRPVNYGDIAGHGVIVLDRGKYQVAVINLIGSVFMGQCDNPFKSIDAVLAEISTPNIIIDFHAEATSEKVALGYYLSGRVSAVIGTHTHVQTADERILMQHTAYISDAGMCGARDSVIGIEKASVIERFITYCPIRQVEAVGQQDIHAVLLTIDDKTGKAMTIKRVAESIN